MSQKATPNYTILHNEYRFMYMTKGLIYTRVYFLLKAVQYVTSRYEQGNLMAKLYFKIAVRGLPPA
ncbi:hypothetical protein FVR03_19590 [Pontibacter qinzhouensis]|uniref:Uncharacterized protein n=1 Tax=Pontibacter qinzhouensis TaxID=2603253 RepID=A0A5C8J4M1_9BACT|nr:hypothetical protein [Pontibacter qinzhouensis]TXK32790.1 hypothetical protein FVR03_19590 [Pontibacter qinzhouensis]